LASRSCRSTDCRERNRSCRLPRPGEIKNFNGIDSPYEPPETAEIRIHTRMMSAEQAAEQIVEELRARQKL
jgi:bifunctional enzyme CysN/CysC